jgi:SAM-dependent methyltransferase
MTVNNSITADSDGTATAAVSVWDSRYASRRGYDISIGNDPWLDRWNNILETSRQSLILELGCGSGRDTRYLTERELHVIAGDYSPQALDICRQHAPLSDVRAIDIREPLPFRNNVFPVIVASLCLHYFPWSQTMAIMAEIRRCLQPGGYLLARVNSTGDRHYGAAGHPEVEPGLHNVDGELKRFFNREAVELLIGEGWRVRNLEELTVHRYDSPKVVWEAVLNKPAAA